MMFHGVRFAQIRGCHLNIHIYPFDDFIAVSSQFDIICCWIPGLRWLFRTPLPVFARIQVSQYRRICRAQGSCGTKQKKHQ